ncbi:MAG: hypothetical protein WBN07_09750 [Woeseiaceae bacterium]|jgi:hypothetical protein
MKPRTRSISGALLMLVIIPAIVGLLACMPVPIGDPERSRIDPALSGAWAGSDDEDSAGIWVFEPYDKRTWLLLSLGFTVTEDEAATGDYDLPSDAGLKQFIASHSVADDIVTPQNKIGLYKVWRTRLGGEWFMTWEPKGVFEGDDFTPEVWFAFRIRQPDANTIELTMLGDKLFKDVEETRRAFERVVKKNARNPELYTDETVRLIRLGSEHFGFVEDLAAEVIAE